MDTPHWPDCLQNPPTVSIIVPCYNHGHYLRQAVDSVLAQTFSDWELIVIDDGSTDDSRAVAASFEDPRVRYVYQENRGLAAARNAGIDHACGSWLAFLDADDTWYPDFLAATMTFLAHDDSLVGAYTGTELMNDVGSPLPSSPSEPVLAKNFRSTLLRGGYMACHSVVISAALCRDLGGFDGDLDGTGAEDWDLWLRIAEHHAMPGLPGQLARYRVTPGSMSSDIERMHANRLAVIDKHFGPPADEPETWQEEKRIAYAYAYRDLALSHYQQGELTQSACALGQALVILPSLASDPSTYYELVCGDQPRGYRGTAEHIDLSANVASALALAERAFAGQRGMRAELFYAAAALGDHIGSWRLARRYLLYALGLKPSLLLRAGTVRRLIKLHLGRSLMTRLKR